MSNITGFPIAQITRGSSCKSLQESHLPSDPHVNFHLLLSVHITELELHRVSPRIFRLDLNSVFERLIIEHGIGVGVGFGFGGCDFLSIPFS